MRSRSLGRTYEDGVDVGMVSFARVGSGDWKVTAQARLLREDRSSYREKAKVLAEYRIRATVTADGTRVDVQEATLVDPPRAGVSLRDPMGPGARDSLDPH